LPYLSNYPIKIHSARAIATFSAALTEKNIFHYYKTVCSSAVALTSRLRTTN